MAAALDRKEKLLSQLRSMNDEAEKVGPDGRKGQASDHFRQAYAQVVLQLKQVCLQPALRLLNRLPCTLYALHLVYRKACILGAETIMMSCCSKQDKQWLHTSLLLLLLHIPLLCLAALLGVSPAYIHS